MATYSFNHYDIRRQVLDFLRTLELLPYDENDILLDGYIHRFRTQEDKPYETSGSICIHTDGWPAGWVQDWRKGIKQDWKFDASALDNEQQAYFNSEEFRKISEEDRRKALLARRKKQSMASEQARILWDSLALANDNHPYLRRKHVCCLNLRVHDNGNLAVPLSDINGIVRSIQWIPADASNHKLFFKDAPLNGLFFSVGLFPPYEGYEGVIIDKKYCDALLVGEGYATMAKVHELTGYPFVAAMSCHSLRNIAEILHKAYPKAKIVIIADNDWETLATRDFNPGIREAQAVVQSGIACDFIAPQFSNKDKGCSDWDDFALLYGDDKARSLLTDKISWAVMSPKQRQEFLARNKIHSLLQHLDPHIQLPAQEFIGGLFPRGYVSIIVAPPGTGKTIFMQKFVSDLSLGGQIFDGFADDEPIRTSLILAGEAGYNLLTRRAASMKWPINSQFVFVVDHYEAQLNEVDFMLDSNEGLTNVVRLLDEVKPDILFVDTFSSFHESDENKAKEIKPIISKLATLARQLNFAIVLVHHTRKRLAKERSLTLNQDDVIGSSVFNRYVGLIVGIEPTKDDEKVLLVQPLKSWFSRFMPFTFTLKENLYGGTTILTDLAPAIVNNSKAAVWFYLMQTFADGEWFTRAQIILSEIQGNVTERQVRRVLTDLVKQGKLKTRGTNKSQEYSLNNKH